MNTLILLAQEADPAATLAASWPTMLGTVASVGFAVWYGWHTTSKTIPQIVRDQRLGMEQMVKDHRAEMVDARKDFREEIAAERIHCRDELERVDHRWKGFQQIVLSKLELAEGGPKT